MQLVNYFYVLRSTFISTIILSICCPVIHANLPYVSNNVKIMQDFYNIKFDRVTGELRDMSFYSYLFDPPLSRLACVYDRDEHLRRLERGEKKRVRTDFSFCPPIKAILSGILRISSSLIVSCSCIFSSALIFAA